MTRRVTTWTVALLVLCATAPGRAGPYLDRQLRYPRVRAAYKAHAADVEAAFRGAGAAWPSEGVFLRAFKSEGEVELWAAPAAGARWVLVRTFPICQASGALGPKRREGDGQVPEGFYHVDRFNPRSSFHLSLGLNYPNPVDRARAKKHRDKPGSDIFIHGDCVTVGCMPLQDAPMEALYVAAVLARDHGQRRIDVHVFPCRLHDKTCARELDRLGAQDPALADFWGTLAPGFEAFETARVPPRVRARATGGYQLRRR